MTGALAHRTVRKLRLDHRTKTFRFDNYWYYMTDFTFDADGALDTVVLSDAHRRELSDDRPASEEPVPSYADDPRYYNVRGDFLILRYAEMQTLNLDYFWLGEAEGEAGPEPAAE